MSALDFGGGSATNTTRSGASSSAAPLLAAGWGVGLWLRHGTFTGTGCLIGAGVDQAASSLQLRTFSGVEYGIDVRDASGANVTCRAAYPSAGDYLLYAQYSTVIGAVQLFLVAAGATVTIQSDSTTATLADITPTSNWYVGGDGTNFVKTPIGEAFLINRALSFAEITLLASGKPITALEPKPQLYYPLRSGAVGTEANRGVAAGGDLVLAGTGYTNVAEFFPVDVRATGVSSLAQALRAEEPLPSSALVDAQSWWGPSLAIEKWAADELAVITSQSASVAQVVETDAAQPIAGQQSSALGQASEADSAQGITAALSQARSVGQVAEADTANSIGALQSRTVAQATETDFAQAITARQARAVGLVTETDAAQAIAPSQRRTLGQIAEADTAQAIGARQQRALGQPSEADSSQPIGSQQSRAIGQVSETDAAQAVARTLRTAVGQVSEADAAQAIGARQARTLGEPSEADSAQPASVSGAMFVGQAAESDTSQPVNRQLVRGVAQVSESDSARPVLALSSLGLIAEIEIAHPFLFVVGTTYTHDSRLRIGDASERVDRGRVGAAMVNAESQRVGREDEVAPVSRVGFDAAAPVPARIGAVSARPPRSRIGAWRQ